MLLYMYLISLVSITDISSICQKNENCHVRIVDNEFSIGIFSVKFVLHKWPSHQQSMVRTWNMHHIHEFNTCKIVVNLARFWTIFKMAAVLNGTWMFQMATYLRERYWRAMKRSKSNQKVQLMLRTMRQLCMRPC